MRFRAGEWIEPKSRIEMVFRMPVGDPCNLVCQGVVLRVDEPTPPTRENVVEEKLYFEVTF